jgi:hypothetical protein
MTPPCTRAVKTRVTDAVWPPSHETDQGFV